MPGYALQADQAKGMRAVKTVFHFSLILDHNFSLGIDIDNQKWNATNATFFYQQCYCHCEGWPSSKAHADCIFAHACVLVFGSEINGWSVIKHGNDEKAKIWSTRKKVKAFSSEAAKSETYHHTSLPALQIQLQRLKVNYT